MKKFFGNILIGNWFKAGADNVFFPRQLEIMDAEGLITWTELQNRPGILWPHIDGNPLDYEEGD
jgi:hypothetical protein